MTLDPGDDAPTISARNQDDEAVTLAFEAPTVLYFYPRDDTRGCTIEAEEFDDELDEYAAAGVAVYGVSTDGVDAHAAFVEKYDLGFDLLADPEGEIADAFGVDTSGGTADRVTFVLADGAVHSVYTGVSPEGHARTVLADIADAGLA